jgi:hypothetical protein
MELDTTKPLVELKNHKLIYKQDPPPKIVLTRRRELNLRLSVLQLTKST